MPPISLYALEALIKDRVNVTVIDEQVDEIDFNINADLVCITSTTTQIKRAYQISEQFLKRGVPTAIGGVHATALPDECQNYFNTVCVGEAEGYIDNVLDDLNKGTLQFRYVNKRTISMEEAPFYQYDISGGKYLPFHVINFSRSCPFKCDFCSIQSTLGSYRTRSVESVVEEITKAGAKNVWFPDATLTANPKRAMELFEGLKPLGIKWLSQITMNVANNDRLLDAMAESGCWLVSIGFETLNARNIKTASKMQNKVDEYSKIIEKLHKRRIAIEGNFVFGFDEDDSSVFDTTVKFIIKSGIDLPEFYVLTPYPDTVLYKNMKKEGRIVDEDWSHYDNTHFHYLPVFQPKNMSREELREGCLYADKAVYKFTNVIRRLKNAGIWRTPVLLANYIYASRIKSRHNLLPVTESISDVNPYLDLNIDDSLLV